MLVSSAAAQSPWRLCIPSSRNTARRGFHGSVGAMRYDPRPILTINRVDVPSPEALQAIIDARRKIFGIVQGDGKRSGRKILRANRYGPAVQGYYPTTTEELKLDKVGLYSPVVEELYRTEEVNKRLGKTRIKGKLRNFRTSFVEKMHVDDAAEGVLDQVDWVDLRAVLPNETEVVEFLEGELGMNEAEVAHFLPLMNEAVLREVERSRAEAVAGSSATADAKAAKSKAEKAARARDFKDLIRTRDDKRQSTRRGAGGEVILSDDESPPPGAAPAGEEATVGEAVAAEAEAGGAVCAEAEAGGAVCAEAEAGGAVGAGAAAAAADGAGAGEPGAGGDASAATAAKAREPSELAKQLLPLLAQWRDKRGAEIQRRYKLVRAAENEVDFQSAVEEHWDELHGLVRDGEEEPEEERRGAAAQPQAVEVPVAPNGAVPPSLPFTPPAEQLK